MALRVIGGSQNQSLNCDTGYTNLSDELANGCRETYTINTGSPNCADDQQDDALGHRPALELCRHLDGQRDEPGAGRAQPADPGQTKSRRSAPRPNNWSSFPNLPDGRPARPAGLPDAVRRVQRLRQRRTVRVTDFATFYVTGWTGQGSGFNNPCEGNGDDPVPNGDPGTIVGHFIIYIDKLNTGGGSGITCSFTSLGTCVLVLTQ